MAQRSLRLKRELAMLQSEPPPGITAWPKEDSIDVLEAQIQGPIDTPYEGGVFKLEIVIPERYPFEPPKVHFVTPIYHPNIDSEGRICLDSLKMPPKGAWKPALNLSTTLASIQLLMNEPNPDDPLMQDITTVYKQDIEKFNHTARTCTLQYAMQSSTSKKRVLTDVDARQEGEVNGVAQSGVPTSSMASSSSTSSESIIVPNDPEVDIAPPSAKRSKLMMRKDH
eukprot:GILK01007647.1.p1 GENE.GILK01007647.1~~GILK01007647.1.p1  ORF type:complete len:225 (+),score=15.12 GILK01007647.1:51-725(+)